MSTRCSASATAAAAASTGSPVAADVAELALRRGDALEKLLVRRRSEAAPEIGDRLQALLHDVERAGLGLERRDEAVELGADLVQPDDEVSELLCARAELGRDPLERSERALGERGERGRTVALVGRDRRQQPPSPPRRALRHAEAARVAPVAATPRRVPCPRSRPRAPATRRDGTQPRRHRASAPRGAVAQRGASARHRAPRAAARAARCRRTRRGRRAGTTAVPGDAARIGPTSRSASLRRPRRPRARPRVPTRTRGYARRRRPGARSRGPPRPPVAARRATRAPPRRRSPPARRAPPRRMPPRRPSRRRSRRRARPGAARSPARRSSSPPRSRP